jgi:hypothetical protein
MFQCAEVHSACGRAAPVYDMSMAFRWLDPSPLLCIGLVFAVACSEESDSGLSSETGGTGNLPSTGGIAASELPYEPCPIESNVGEFLIELGPDFTSVEGKVEDGVTPGLIPIELASAGECRLVTLPNLLCDPACPATTETCGANNQCQPLPAAHDVGTVTVTGLVRTVEMTANANTGNYRPGPPALPYPGFAPGADLRLASSGGDYAPFELRGWGIDVLNVPAEPITISEGQPASVTWVPPTSAGPARVNARLNINNHGSSNTAIECDFPDTGSGQIPAALVDGLIAEGASGFPTITLSRRTASRVDIAPGCVQLLVKSELPLDVTLSGLVSCDDDSVCPEGQTCTPLERFCQ